MVTLGLGLRKSSLCLSLGIDPIAGEGSLGNSPGLGDGSLGLILCDGHLGFSLGNDSNGFSLCLGIILLCLAGSGRLTRDLSCRAAETEPEGLLDLGEDVSAVTWHPGEHVVG